MNKQPDQRPARALTDKVAIVTGSGRGLGAAIAKKFASEGASVIVSDILFEQARQVAGEITNSGGRSIALKVDVTVKSDVENLVKETVAQFGAVHIMVNNAGIMKQAPLTAMAEEDWDRVLNVDLKGVFLGTQAVMPHMMKQRYGKIINLSSVGGLHAINQGRSAYGAAKAAVAQLTRITASEAGTYGINVNAIAPGRITPREDKTMSPERQAVIGRLDDIYRSRAALGRLGQPGDVANLALFLASEASSFITGQVIQCDGGLFLSISDGVMDRPHV